MIRTSPSGSPLRNLRKSVVYTECVSAYTARVELPRQVAVHPVLGRGDGASALPASGADAETERVTEGIVSVVCIARRRIPQG